MSTRKHKRRRIDTDAQHLFDDEELAASPQKSANDEIEQEPDPAEVEEEPLQAEGEGDAEASAKEREVWDAFREEHYELLEQLPLSLHRAFTLIHELDQQAQNNISNIAPAILKYVSLRKALADAAQPKADAPQDPAEPSDAPEEQVDATAELPLTNGKTTNGALTSSAATATPGPSSKRQTPLPVSKSLASVVEGSTSTRELLVHIAQASEEVTRACAEKVYLAQHAYDLVDRYIRDLDRAIKEQEASISLGLRPGTHPASIILPEVVPPQSSRGRVVASPPPPSAAVPIFVPASSPVPAPVPVPAPAPIVVEPPEQPVELTVEPVEEIDVTEEAMDEEPPPEPPAPEPPAAAAADVPEPAPPSKLGRGKRRRRGRGQPAPAVTGDATEVAPEEIVDVVAPQEEVQAPLTLRIPAQALAQIPVVVDDLPPDPNEPRYCFCNQVSFGDMIACDNPTCTREWFHIGCVGLTKIPKGNWYCRECAALRKRSKSRKRAR